jgi:hypothetical protein
LGAFPNKPLNQEKEEGEWSWPDRGVKGMFWWSINGWTALSCHPVYRKCSNKLRKLQMELELHVALFLKKIENHTFKFQKIWNKKSWCRKLRDLLVCKKINPKLIVYLAQQKGQCIDLDLVNNV